MKKLYLNLILLVLFIMLVLNTFSIDILAKYKLISVFYESKVFNVKLGTTINDFSNTYSIDIDNIENDYDINLPLYDGQIINKKSTNLKLSINSASIVDLIKLKGIGKTLALRIIKYREDNNGFKYLEELKNISGIGDKKYEQIKEYITL